MSDMMGSVCAFPALTGSSSRILTFAVTESPVKQEILNTTPFCHTVPPALDFTNLIIDLIHQYAAQVCFSVCLSVSFYVCVCVCPSVCLFVIPCYWLSISLTFY